MSPANAASRDRPSSGGQNGSRGSTATAEGSDPSPRQARPSVEVRLRILDGPAAGTEYAIAGSVVRLGRGDENDIVLPDNNASRVHAEVVRDNGGRFLVRDLGSRNGIFVNRKKVPQASLSNGDRIRIGGTSVQFLTGEGPVDSVDGQVPGGAALKRWVLVAATLGGVVFLISRMGGERGGETRRDDRPAVSPGGDPSRADPPLVQPGQVSLGGLLSGGGGNKGVEVGRNQNTRTNRIPVATAKAPDGEVQSIMIEGDRAASSAKLPDARAFYARAVSLDPECENCRNKLEKMDAEIKREVESSLSAGVGYFNTDRFDEARRSFEKVKLLDPDPKSLSNGNATNYINLINSRMAESAR